jgi:hypothetical protein
MVLISFGTLALRTRSDEGIRRIGRAEAMPVGIKT